MRMLDVLFTGFPSPSLTPTAVLCECVARLSNKFYFVSHQRSWNEQQQRTVWKAKWRFGYSISGPSFVRSTGVFALRWNNRVNFNGLVEAFRQSFGQLKTVSNVQQWMSLDYELVRPTNWSNYTKSPRIAYHFDVAHRLHHQKSVCAEVFGRTRNHFKDRNSRKSLVIGWVFKA